MKKVISSIVICGMFLSLIGFDPTAGMAANPKVNLQEQNTMSVLWFQTSGEAKALYYQGYSIGKLRLDEILKNKRQEAAKKPAVVLDIDETILDNSPYQAWTVLKGKEYPIKWNEWIHQASASALPGAVEFLKYAEAKGVAIYYVSNRNESQKEATIQNLKQVGAPMADAEHVLLHQQMEKGKDARRQHVAKTNDIVLLFGDNLGDFEGFDHFSSSKRVECVEKQRDEFGKKLIVFPNPIYGDWEGAIYQGDYGITDDEKSNLRKDSLQPFQSAD